MKKIYAYFFVFSFVILSSSLCAMEEEVLPNNQANVQLLKQRIKKYLSKREKYLKHSEDHSDSFLRFEEMIGCYKCDEEKLFSTLTKNCNCLNSFTGVSPLISVIQTTGSVLQAEMLLLAGAHIDGQPSKLKNMPNRYRKSSLHTALAFRQPKVVKLLLKYGANPNAQTENGETPLHIAVLEGYVELVRLLLEKGADSTIKNNYDELPLDYAYKYKVKKKIISLLNKNDDNVGHDREQLDYETLLRKKIQELLDYKKNLSERDCRKFFDNELPFSQYLCLGKSIEEASVEEVCKGLDKGISRIDGSTRARWWFDPINNSFLNFVIQACSSYSVNLFVELIILAGADVNGKRKTERFTLFHPLNKAINAHKLDTIPLLLRFGSNPSVKNKNIKPPLISAVEKNLYSVVKLFLEKGVDPNCVNKNGATCLHVAAQRGSRLMVKLLLQHGACANIEDNYKQKAIDYAYMFNDELIVETFEKWSSDNISLHGIKNKKEIQDITLINAAKKELALYLKENKEKSVESDWFEKYKPKKQSNAQLLKNKINVYFKKQRSNISNLLILCEQIGAVTPSVPNLYKSLCEYDFSTEKATFLLCDYVKKSEYREHAISVVEMLLLAGANPNVKHEDKSLLHRVCSFFSSSSVKVLIKALLDAGAKVHDEQLGTLLHKFLRQGRYGKEDIDIVGMLVDAGVDVRAKDKNGKTALDVATENCSQEVVERLKEADDSINNYKLELEQKTLQFVQQYPARFAEFEKSIGVSVPQDKRSDESNRVKEVLDSLGLFKKTYEAAKLLLDYIADDKRVAEVALLLYAGVDPNFKSILYAGLDKPLILATCINPNHKILKLLLAFEADPNITDRSKISSPLRNVVVANDYQCATMLLRAGAKINDGIKGKSLLRIAQELNNRRMIELLSLYALEEKLEVRNHIYEIILEFEDGHEKHFFNDSLNMIEPRKKQVLDEQYIHIVQQLERLSIDEDEEEEFNDKEFLNSFCRILQKSKADPKYKKKKLEQKIINYLQKPPKQKENCADIDKKSADFISKVYFCKSEIKEIVQVLLRGCNIFNVPSQNDDGITYAIHHAVKCNDSLFLELLLLAGCDPNKQTSKSKRTALHYAAKKGNLIMIKLLQAAGADVNIKDTNGQTPQEYAQKIDLSKYFEWL